jgi:hypothetical protein
VSLSLVALLLRRKYPGGHGHSEAVTVGEGLEEGRGEGLSLLLREALGLLEGVGAAPLALCVWVTAGVQVLVGVGLGESLTDTLEDTLVDIDEVPPAVPVASAVPETTTVPVATAVLVTIAVPETTAVPVPTAVPVDTVVPETTAVALPVGVDVDVPEEVEEAVRVTICSETRIKNTTKRR